MALIYLPWCLAMFKHVKCIHVFSRENIHGVYMNYSNMKGLITETFSILYCLVLLIIAGLLYGAKAYTGTRYLQYCIQE